eukprot:GHVN01030651.1.p1 GENE.GHVN01030651.1~~GHVN01030651.1.p1  ORF type:complete len:114 (+),score=17.31 GHVN01030651.1:270-611(+)
MEANTTPFLEISGGDGEKEIGGQSRGGDGEGIVAPPMAVHPLLPILLWASGGHLNMVNTRYSYTLHLHAVPTLTVSRLVTSIITFPSALISSLCPPAMRGPHTYPAHFQDLSS